MTGHIDVPFLDLSLLHGRVASEVAEGFERVLKSTGFVLGPEVSAFEEAFAQYCGVDHVVGVANGTDALEIALVAAGVAEGDEVIIPANTFVATAEAVVRVGARVVLADCDDNYLIDPAEVARRTTRRTRAVVPVHLYGQTADVEGIRAAVGPDVLIVEDAAQSQGARRNGRRAGALGDVAATSFYPGKNLGAYGDAGAVMTSSPAMADRATAIRNHGGNAKYEHRELGRNSRLDALQAVVLAAKLRHLDTWNDERRAAASRYEELFADRDDIRTPLTAQGNEHVFHLYVVRVPERDRVLEDLQRAGIGAGLHYPTPVHLLEPFLALGLPRHSYPVTERLSAAILSLPMFPGITPSQQEQVAEAVTASVRSR